MQVRSASKQGGPARPHACISLMATFAVRRTEGITMTVLEIILLVIVVQLGFCMYALGRIYDDVKAIRAVAWKRHFGG